MVTPTVARLDGAFGRHLMDVLDAATPLEGTLLARTLREEIVTALQDR